VAGVNGGNLEIVRKGGVVGNSAELEIGPDIALGLGDHRGRKGSGTLARFAKHVSALWYRQWEEGGVAALRSGETLMSESFLLWAMQNARTIHFNLDGISAERFGEFARNGKFGYGNIANWELQQLLSTELGEKAVFYGRGGSLLAIDDVRRMFQ